PPAVHLTAGPGADRPAALLAEYLGERPRTDQGPEIRLQLRGGGAPAEGPAAREAHRLEIDRDRVLLTAAHEAGLFHGVQSLRQLLAEDGGSWPALCVEDAPALPWRGVMLDVARHFMPLEFLYAFTDQAALHKFNVLHLHLTDDQGWRIEIDGLPRLTEVGAHRAGSMIGPAGSGAFDTVPHGGFYTQAELRDLARYAERRGVLVVPEIEMPGHSRAALAAYPGLGAVPRREGLPVWTSWGISEDVLGVHEDVFAFCREVLGQTVDVFPGRYVHIGGDECPTVQWETEPYPRRRAAELGLAAPARLHGYFLGRIHAFLAECGRRAVSWDEAAPGTGDLPSDLVLTAWMNPQDAARSLGRGHQVIMAPHQSTFFDYAQSAEPYEPQAQPGQVITLEDAYRFDALGIPGTGERLPVADPFADGAARTPGVLGTQAQFWSEFLPTPAHVRYVAYPRLCAFAEAAWSTGPRDYDDFRARLAHHLPRLTRLGALPPERAAHLAAGLASGSGTGSGPGVDGACGAPGAPGEPARIGA
ncbi:beta-N-acetylhexosaminidase, partial [Actinospica durhamensis]